MCHINFVVRTISIFVPNLTVQYSPLYCTAVSIYVRMSYGNVQNLYEKVQQYHCLKNRASVVRSIINAVVLCIKCCTKLLLELYRILLGICVVFSSSICVQKNFLEFVQITNSEICSSSLLLSCSFPSPSTCF